MHLYLLRLYFSAFPVWSVKLCQNFPPVLDPAFGFFITHNIIHLLQVQKLLPYLLHYYTLWWWILLLMRKGLAPWEGSNAGKGGKGETKEITSSKVDGFDYSSEGNTMERDEGSGGGGADHLGGDPNLTNISRKAWRYSSASGLGASRIMEGMTWMHCFSCRGCTLPDYFNYFNYF